MARIGITVNGERREVDVAPETPLLWVLRDALGLTGTKFGCGVAQCGACTVHVEGAGGAPTAVRSCTLPASAAAGRRVTTIEGLAPDAERLHPVQRAWVEEDVPQCGYCQAGMIMSAAALLERTPDPTATEVNAALSGHICRCGTYDRIRAAVARAVRETAAARAARPEVRR